MAEEEEKTEGTEEPKKSKKGLIIIIVAVLLLGGGGAGFALMSGGGDKKEGAEEVIHYEQIELDTFIVNLNEHNAFLKVKMVLEYNPKLVHGDQAEGGGHGGGSATGGGYSGGSEPSGPPGVLGTRAPMIKDAILQVLSSKSSKEVLSPEGKEQLKQELVEAINEACDVQEGPVVNVYFTEFIVQ